MGLWESFTALPRLLAVGEGLTAPSSRTLYPLSALLASILVLYSDKTVLCLPKNMASYYEEIRNLNLLRHLCSID